jgi:hypothetical protein
LEQLSIKKLSLLLTEEDLNYKDLIANHTVVKLKVNNCDLASHIFSFISKVFPCLESLSVILVTEDRDLPRENLTLDMSNISLKHLEFFFSLYYSQPFTESTPFINGGACIKVSTNEKVKYLLFSFMDDDDKCASMKDYNGLKFTKYLNAFEFESKENDEQYLIYTMQFKSIERITIKYTSFGGYPRDIDFFF